MVQTWIRMELVPLPTSEQPAALLYWNPDSGELVGDEVASVHQLIADTLVQGLTGDLARVELSDPYRKPTELAAVLSQHYLVIPEPVMDVPIFVAEASTTVN
jgi:hypothetical protein